VAGGDDITRTSTPSFDWRESRTRSNEDRATGSKTGAEVSAFTEEYISEATAGTLR
jgi:hypothetical protein